MAWFGVGSGSRRAKPERAQQFEQADRVVVEAFADLHEARRLRSNPAISLGAVQRFERKAWDRLIDCLIECRRYPATIELPHRLTASLIKTATGNRHLGPSASDYRLN
jgi:hypothetical protein